MYCHIMVMIFRQSTYADLLKLNGTFFREEKQLRLGSVYNEFTQKMVSYRAQIQGLKAITKDVYQQVNNPDF